MPQARLFFTLLLCAAWALLPACDRGADATSATAGKGIDDQPEPQPPADIEHLKTPPADPRAALEDALATGELAPTGDARQFLHYVLATTGVPTASQVLVFSKTSLQSPLISPSNPRAIYFSDDFYVGYVPGGIIEISDTDPDEGTGFYALDPREPRSGTRSTHPQLEEPASCLNCHSSSRTSYAAGLLVRSVYPDEEGFPITSAGSFVTGHESPLEERWGGWYVTGHHGTMRHMGNTIAKDLGNDAAIDLEPGANLATLDHLIATNRYLAPGSDIVALMVLEHQAPMHNHLTQGSMSVRQQTFRSRRVAESGGGTFDPYASDTLMSLVNNVSGRIVKHMLFVDEHPLADAVQGDRAFVRQFRASRREADDGRSLKDLDLQTRLFRYRCSYMIYSRAFDQMPDLLKEVVYQKLYDALTGPESELNAHLEDAERAEILDILRQTKDDLPGYWAE